MASRGVPRTYQAVKAATEKVHSSHLHRGGGQGWAAHWGAEVQVEEVTQQVPLGGNDIWLLTRGRSSRGCLRALCALAPLGTQEGENQKGWGQRVSGGQSPHSAGSPPGQALGLLTVP